MGKLKQCGNRYIADYVIVGTGLAGSVLAGRLTEDLKTSVIAIEGGVYDINELPIRDPIFAGVEYGLPTLYFPEYFWQQRPVPNGSLSQPTWSTTPIHCSNIPINQTATTVGDYTTGRLLGGGSSINGMQYVRGSPGLYQIWAQFGLQWSVPNVERNFVALENYHGLTPVPNLHGFNGPVSIRQAPVDPTTMAVKFVQAVTDATGLPRIPDDDYNNPLTNLGPFERWELFQKPDKLRESAATAFLGPTVLDSQGNGLNGRHLKVLFKTLSDRIIWDPVKKVALGVKAIFNGQTIEVFARKKVIICQGNYSSDLLQRSGIGPTDLLSCLGIDIIQANPNVGKNWTNQTFVTIVFTANPADPGLPPNDPQALYTGGAFLPPLLPSDNPNLRGYQLIGANIPAIPNVNPNLFVFLLVYLQPKSLGTIRIQSTDPTRVSLVDNNYFGDPRDLEAYVAGIQTYVTSIATALHQIDPTYNLISPPPGILNDPTALADFVIGDFNHTHHWMGSNRMANSIDQGVVDGFGNVFGVTDLMVVDNSISPHISDGNTAGPIFVLAYTIANYLLEQQRCIPEFLPIKISKHHKKPKILITDQ